MTLTDIILTAFGLVLFSGFLAFTLVSLIEKHTRAARRGFTVTVITLLIFLAIFLSPPTVQVVFLAVSSAGLLALTIWLALPAGQQPKPSPPPQEQVDERTIMFARARLQPGTPEFEAYYKAHPDHQQPDDDFRRNPGLLMPGTAFHHPLLAASPEGGFFLTESLSAAVNGLVASTQSSAEPGQLTQFVKRLASYHGAVDVGICELKPYHIYSHIGRGSGEYGAPIDLDHRYAIAFTVEMAHEMVNVSPKMPAVMESARQYVEAGKIAVILAAAIRSLGYPARAHIDGNYRVIAPLVAQDAGLGQIGRMGILMTPRLGPRVRLGVITTDLPLNIDSPSWDPTVIDFCNHCIKCAAVCPAQAIPTGTRQSYPDGTLRWKINPERCYTYWTKIGTDCGRCMAVCPYAHADNLFHNLIRFGVKHSGNFRRAAGKLDDFFYGEKPAPHAPPKWLKDR